jgi:hypothetical protein
MSEMMVAAIQPFTNVIAILLLLVSTAQAELYEWTQPADYHSAVVKVKSGQAGGSGCYVRHKDLSFVLTAAHVTRSKTATVTFQDGRQFTGTTTYDRGYSPRERHINDIAAILIGEVEGITPVPIADGNLYPAFEVCGFGGPSHDFRHFEARVTERGQSLVTGNGKVTNGDSGGPWIYNGTVVGISSTGGDSMGAISNRQGQRYDVFTTCNSAQTKAIREFSERLHTVQCSGGNCQHGGGGMGGGISEADLYPPQRPTTPEQKPWVPPDRPNPTVPIQPTTPAKECECEHPTTEDIVTSLIIKFKSSPELIALLKGDPGENGSDGTNGIDGIDATADNIDIDALVAKLPPFFPQWVDENRNVIDEIPGGVRLGDKLKMRVQIDVNLIKSAVAQALEEAGK